MSDSEPEMSVFADLEEKDREEIEQTPSDLEKQIRSIEDVYES